ncbi:hypothetical protein BSKO_01737 [Bryopsis sp. KO-2023]|nr:hypothetical protein BSKO_01737 [Bryopsis sp. KO-2023]
MSLFIEAIKGGKQQLEETRGLFAKVRTGGTLAGIFATELFKSLQSVTYGIRALHLYRCLPHPSKNPGSCLHLDKNVSYSGKERTIMDIYTPGSVQSGEKQHPVALFCHGGVWASGDPWNYAPLAATLAEGGVVTCVMTHTLYPNAVVPEMVLELSSALDWVFNNISKHGGSPDKVSLVGHSSGAHLCMMALLRRAKILSEGKAGTELTRPNGHSGIPKRFVGICGAYSIAEHFEYEKGRGVHGLSCMERAMEGKEKFEAMSPAVVVDRIVSPGKGCKSEYPKKTLKHLPALTLLAAEEDTTVPCTQTTGMAASLKRAGIEADIELYKGINHTQVVIDWPTDTPRGIVMGGGKSTEKIDRVDFKKLGTFQSDLLKLLAEES